MPIRAQLASHTWQLRLEVIDDHAVTQSAHAAREGAEHLVRQLGSLQQREHRRTREAIRRGREREQGGSVAG